MILIGENSQNYWAFYVIKKKLFFSCVCIKWLILPKKKTLENNDVEVIVDSVNALWLNKRNIEEKLGHKNFPVVTNKYNKIYKKCRYQLVDKPIKQPNRRFLHINLALKIIMDCRTDKSCSLKKI